MATRKPPAPKATAQAPREPLLARRFLPSLDIVDAGAARITILSDFLVWLERRENGGQLIDLRLIKNQTAKIVVDKLMGSDKFS